MRGCGDVAGGSIMLDGHSEASLPADGLTLGVSDTHLDALSQLILP